ncbi:RNA helicase NPH-II [Melanoplus sanguinipes entomopoxvirus]|uniref:RNA helicase NPH-II n=1 Tax=Melanoplus sanguinipes entomopoxvirus TaxID=83191 RepID=NPH2_MSEPV|nr:RNA helicase NPH-II [Melanoplus sanguinipes entomopoxvirus]Q9YW06.1 RecName: Full=RNA helicase NPH-II; AltName: Full=Nucleoside triphosphatase II; Short=NTPase II; AltName: Full=Nucleoside triphosphate phosphohydrolase II; Short=NPH II [Melanoplus sanguinipes entomopoxvirus]AAC97810.1 ORF MSV086 putative RNA helicase (vaccinia I8R), similar to GB:L22579 [Melanoplus sanguinipes entomopoxvirus 'O']
MDMQNITDLYKIDKKTTLYPNIINKYNYMAYLLFPNNATIFNSYITKKEVFEYPMQFAIALYPVYKLYWHNINICLNNRFIYLSNEFKNNISINTVYNLLYNNELKFEDDNIIINGKNLKISYSAYSYVTIISQITINISSLNKYQIYGIIESANYLGILSSYKQNKYFDKNLFSFTKSELRSTMIDVQLKIFEIFISKKNCIISGGTGIGKTTVIPKLFWWFNLLFDGYEFWNTSNENKNINDFIFKPNFEKNKTILSLPRKALIRQMGINYIKSLGFDNISGSPIILKYKDVKKEKEYYNNNPILYPFVLSVNRITINNIKHSNSVIIDEIHEHDKFGDIAIAIARTKKKKYNIRNIVLISATIESDIDNIRIYFKNIVEIYIPGVSLFPVKEIECEDKDVISILKNYMPSVGKSVIIFYETIKKINEYKEILESILIDKIYKIYTIHSKITNINAIINKLQNDKKHIHIILSTNYLESSITITNATLVIDNGKMYQKKFLTGSTMYITESMYIQRKGRVGRISKGTYIRTYSKDLLQTTFKHINYQYLWEYILVFKYNNMDYYNDLFIKPDDPSRIENTLNYLKNINIDIDKYISLLYSKFNKYEINMVEYLSIYINNSTSDIILLNEFIDNIRNSDKYIFPYRLTEIFHKLNVRCRCINITETEEGNINCSFVILNNYDGDPFFKLSFEKSNLICRYNKIYYIVSMSPLYLID